MFKQIIQTCETYTFEEMYKNDDLTDYMNDKLMMERCSEITIKLMEGNMDLNKTCELVKDYQQKYIHIHKQNPVMAKDFTLELWCKTLKFKELSHFYRT